jgi:hypothetical protein
VTLPHLPTELILQRASLASVAVESTTGAHVTVQAFAWSAGRLWLLAPTDSLKVRAITRRPLVGITVRRGEQAVMMSGVAELIAVWPPRAESFSSRLPFGLGWYFARNAAITVGIVTDLLSRDMPGLSSRTLISFSPQRQVTVDNGVIIHETGTWPEPTRAPTYGAPPTIDTEADLLPPEQRQLLRQATQADVGWLTASGPLSVPATVSAGLASMPTNVLTKLGQPIGNGALTVHASEGNRPSRYSGVMLRGQLVYSADGAVGVEAERLTWWEGYTSTTVAVTARPEKVRRPTP